MSAKRIFTMTNLSLPTFSLPGTDDQTHSSAEMDGNKANVIIITCNHCPYAKAYIKRINAFVKKYESQGVGIFAINPNDAVKYPEDSFKNMKPMAEAFGLEGKYLFDETQETARALGAQRTPECYVFDASGQLAYHGAFDDSWDNAASVTQRYLENAVDAVLAGQPPAIAETPAVGCSVKWK